MMTQSEISNQLRGLPTIEQISIVEEILKSIREKIIENDKTQITVDKREMISRAAKDLFSEYSQNKELTAFTSLDSEKFYE